MATKISGDKMDAPVPDAAKGVSRLRSAGRREAKEVKCERLSGRARVGRSRDGILCPCTQRTLLVLARLATSWFGGAGVEAAGIPCLPSRPAAGATVKTSA